MRTTANDVSPAALLRRPERALASAVAVSEIRGRRVVVTGGAGSIGSELVRQLRAMEPATLHVLDHDESAMHRLSLELHGHGLLDDDSMWLCDVRDGAAVRRAAAELLPDIVFHVAAHKHLPVLERHPGEAVKTNVLGTFNVVSAAVDAGARTFINVSTDKAARPTSALGMSKRIAERVVAAVDGRTRTASVRFGNVLGSRGSLLDSLRHQLAEGLPVTITDRAATRFFMTIPEAATLVLETAHLARSGRTYVLDMGEPVRITDLVSRYAGALGLRPRIRVTGLRPGEKLGEELLDGAEDLLPTAHPRIGALRSRDLPTADLLLRIQSLADIASVGDRDEIVAAMTALLPNDAVRPAQVIESVGAQRPRMAAAAV